MTAQEHINQIRNLWTSADPKITSTTANALNDIVHSIFGDAARIGYELLQNADDADAKNATYVLLDKYLIISHNGKHFNHDNIEALCRYGANQVENILEEDSKQKDINKIGYKGIGFKSVFNIADKVYIFSKEYSFRFDKSHWGTKVMPWQITPIYTEGGDIPIEIQPFLDFENVNFVIELRTGLDIEKEVEKEIVKAIKKEEIILFLRNVCYFEFKKNTISLQKIIKVRDGYTNSLEKYTNNILVSSSRWHIVTFTLLIPEYVHISLKDLDKRVCPDKLKKAESIEVSFGAKLKEDNTIIELGVPFVFSYLPLDIRFSSFPFLINSNFLMNPSRTEFLGQKWNEFIFEQIGYYQFEWFKIMANDERFKFEFAGLLVKYTAVDPDPIKRLLKTSLNKGVEKAQQEVAFVPVLESSELKKAPETIYDKTKISSELNDYQLVKEEFDKPYEIADPKIKHINNLVKVGSHEFDRQKLQSAIRKGKRFRNPEDNSRLLDYFYRHISTLENKKEQSEWQKVLYETPFLLDQDSNLQEPPMLYFPEEKPELPIDLPMAFLHEVVYQNKVQNNSAIQLWLKNLGTASPKPVEIIRKGLFPMIENDQINNQNGIHITRYIFSHRNKLEETDYNKLQVLPILTKGNSLRKAKICYLANEYEPNLKLEQHIKDDIFISINYIVEQDDIESWKAFWLRLKVRQDMELELYENWFDYNDPNLHTHNNDYLKFLQPFLPQHKADGRKEIYSILIPRYIQYTTEFDFARQYWELLLSKRWKELQQKCGKAKFKHTNGTAVIPSNFEFLVQTNLCFPATDENCYKTLEVYSQSLKDIVKDWKPISYFELTLSQEKLLGIKSQLAIDDCIALLESIAINKDGLDKERITALYKYILNNFDAEAVLNVVKSDTDLQLLAINNTFQPISKLQYFDLPNFFTKADSIDYIFLDFAKNEALNFCKLFAIEVINEGDLELKWIPNIDSNQSFISEWHLKLPYIAVISSFKKGSNYESENERLIEKTEETVFKASDELSLVLNKNEELIYQKDVSAWQKDKEIYYAADWQDKRVIFEFAEVLCNYFEIKETQRELELILTLEKDVAYDWLEKQGFDVTVIKNIMTEKVAPLFKVIETNESRKSENGIHIIPKTITTVVLPPEVAEDIGKKGEKYVCENKIIDNYYIEKGIEVLSIVWENEKAESRSPFDFIVVLVDDIIHYWEVKSTSSATKAEFPISSNEIQFALENSEVYFIIRIFNTLKEEVQPKYRIWSNPIELIKNGKIKISDVKMEIIDEK